MGHSGVVDQRYLGDEYARLNPTWDLEDSPWKAGLVLEALRCTGLGPSSIAEVGCGAGGVLASLRQDFPNAQLFGFDIAPGAAEFWERYSDLGIQFVLGDFCELGEVHYDTILLLDVIEHLADPHAFLEGIRCRASNFVFHIPLDLSAVSVLRESPLLNVRRKVGHLHYFTKSLALELLHECGFEIVNWKYSGAAFGAPKRNWKTRFASIVRKVAYSINRDVGVRLLGGETLVVVARQKPC